jgi:hypothetical protein
MVRYGSLDKITHPTMVRYRCKHVNINFILIFIKLLHKKDGWVDGWMNGWTQL